MIHPIPIMGVQTGDCSDGNHGLRCARSADLVNRCHAAQVLQNQDEAMIAVVEIAIEKGRRTQGNVGRQLAIVIVLAAVQAQAARGLKGLRMGTVHLDDDSLRQCAGFSTIGQMATQDGSHHANAGADVFCGDMGNLRAVGHAAGGQRLLHPGGGDCAFVFGNG